MEDSNDNVPGDALPTAAPTPAAPAPTPPDLMKVFGWFSIAVELDVSERTASGFAGRDRDPLPVEFGHKGVWAYRFALTAWVRRQNVPYHVHLELLRVQKDIQRKRTAAARLKKKKLRAPRGDQKQTMVEHAA